MKTERVKLLSRGNRAIMPYLILLLGFCFTLLVYYYFSKLTQEHDRINFERSVQEIQDQIRLRTETSIALLRAGTGLFAASDAVTAKEFDRFIKPIELEKNYPGVLGIGFARRFSAGEKDIVTGDMLRQGVKDFEITPESPPRNEYIVILYLQPPNDKNKRAIGFDMATEEVRRQAMEAARDSGKPTASGRVTLIQEQGESVQQQGFLIYVPVYRKGALLDTESERRQALIGFVYSPFRGGDFLAEVNRQKSYDVSFKVYDGENLLSPAVDEDSGKPLFSGSQNVAGG